MGIKSGCLKETPLENRTGLFLNDTQSEFILNCGDCKQKNVLWRSIEGEEMSEYLTVLNHRPFS